MADNKSDKKEIMERVGLIKLCGVIDSDKVQEVIDRILVANLSERDTPLRLWVDSAGGSVHQGFALIDIMRWSRVPIATCGLGVLGSMGLMIFMAGTPGMRTLMPSVTVMSHRFACLEIGNHADHLAARDHQDMTHRRILDHYRRHSSLHEDEAIERELLRATDRWLSPEQTVAFGLADRIWHEGDQA